MPLPVRRPRLRVRLSVRLRREGGSLSLTIPRTVVRRWNLVPGDRLIVRSTDHGLLLFPREYLPFTKSPRRLPPPPPPPPLQPPQERSM